MAATRRHNPYWDHIPCYKVDRGTIGRRDEDDKLEPFWQIDQEGAKNRLYMVCPHCRNIEEVGIERPDPNGEISCMFCPYCKIDCSFILDGWKENS